MDYGRFLGWLILNLAVPLLAPIALLPLLGASNRHRGRIGAILRRSLREGQLFWTVIAMCAAAWHEAAVRLGQLEGTAQQRSIDTALAWTAIGWHTVIIIVSSVLVLLVTMDAVTDETQPARPASAGGRGNIPGMTLISICTAAVTAASFTATHLWANRVLY